MSKRTNAVLRFLHALTAVTMTVLASALALRGIYAISCPGEVKGIASFFAIYVCYRLGGTLALGVWGIHPYLSSGMALELVQGRQVLNFLRTLIHADIRKSLQIKEHGQTYPAMPEELSLQPSNSEAAKAEHYQSQVHTVLERICRVFELPETYTGEYCFAGGHDVTIRMVDWFCPVEGLGQPAIPKDQWLEKVGTQAESKSVTYEALYSSVVPFLLKKQYIKPDRKYLVLFDFGAALTFSK